MQKTLTKERLAAKLDGMEYQEELPGEWIDAAWRNNLVIIHGDNQDRIRLDGVMMDEIRAYEGAIIRLDRRGILPCPCGNHGKFCDRCLRQALASGEVIELKAWWCGRHGDEDMDSTAYALLGKPAWCFECRSIEGKFATFNIKERQDYGEGVDYFCRAVVIDLDELWPNTNKEQQCKKH